MGISHLGINLQLLAKHIQAMENIQYKNRNYIINFVNQTIFTFQSPILAQNGVDMVSNEHNIIDHSNNTLAPHL